MKRPYGSILLIGGLTASSLPHVGAYNVPQPPGRRTATTRIGKKRPTATASSCSPIMRTSNDCLLQATPCPFSTSVVWEALQKKKAPPNKKQQEKLLIQRRRPRPWFSSSPAMAEPSRAAQLKSTRIISTSMLPRNVIRAASVSTTSQQTISILRHKIMSQPKSKKASPSVSPGCCEKIS
jgi:hypothetical protein